MSMSQDDKKKILDTRAKELAKVTSYSLDKKEGRDITIFRLGDQQYAFDSLFIKEIVPLPRITVLPCVPSFVAGIMNLRGKIISLLYLDKLLQNSVSQYSEQPQVIILSHDEMEFGLLVDEINGVAQIDNEELQESIPTLNETASRYLKGITPDHLILLDALRMLDDPAIRVNEEVL